MLILTLVLPSLNRIYLRWDYMFVQDVGEIHRVVNKYYSRSPLSEPELFVGLRVDCFMSGRIHRRGGEIINSRSPSMNRNLRIFYACYAHPILCIFDIYHLSGPAGEVNNIIGVADPYIVYI